MEGTGNVNTGRVKEAPKMPPQGQHITEKLNQRSKLSCSLAKMAGGGFAVALTIGYFTLYFKKKPEATAIDVARVTTGISSAGNTHPHKWF